MDERVNRWHTVESELGALAIDAPGVHTLTLKAETMDAVGDMGLTVSGIRLVPVKAGAPARIT